MCVHGSGVSHRQGQSAAIRVGFTLEVQACVTCSDSSQGASRGTSYVEALCAMNELYIRSEGFKPDLRVAITVCILFSGVCEER